MSTPRHERPLFKKYAAVLAGLVGTVLLVSWVVEISFSDQENRAALLVLQEEKARAASGTIQQFIADIVRQIGWTDHPRLTTGQAALEQRREDFLRLLRQVPAVTEVTYIDSEGREQLRVSRLSLDVLGGGADFSRNPAFVQSQTSGSYFGPVYFRSETEPHMLIGLRESAAIPGVTITEVNLTLIWETVRQIQVGRAGYAYIVDRNGQLIAHPELSLVLQRMDVSWLPQVKAALSDERTRPAGVETDVGGRSVLAARAAVSPVGWFVFVEQPLEEAFVPLYASLTRTLILLAGGFLLAVLASLLLARRMVSPIQALKAGASRIGAGELDLRIEVHTGDELEALAEEFNRMAAHLRESYATLEQQVQERTHDLAQALSDLEEKSQQLEVASRHKSEFLASMSHELRTPLNAVIGFSQVLREQMAGDLNAKQHEYVEDILASGQHLLSLINDILDLSKVEAGHMELELTAFPLQRVLEDGLTMVREQASRQEITLSLQVDERIGSIWADERKVKQIVFNLLANAVKFTPPGGRIWVAATESDGEVQVSVRDTGIGIAPEDQERIFEAFRQAGGEAGRGSEGTGLGLALARRFVELHGGRIWLESAPGMGSTFTFALPPTRRDLVTTRRIIPAATEEPWQMR